VGEAQGAGGVTPSRAPKRPAVARGRRPASGKASRAHKSPDLLFEIGVEELPSSYVPPALEQMERMAKEGLAELRLAFDGLETTGTPRRIALLVRGLAARQADHQEEAQGPAVRVAYDATGAPTPALLGFCKGKGVDVSAVRRIQTPKGEYVAVTLEHKGRTALDVLPGFLASLATRIQFPKTMRWLPGDDTRFARPVRWIVALLGDRVVGVRAFGLKAGRHTRGHRFLLPKPIELRSAGDYGLALEKACVVADHRARAQRLEKQLERSAREAGGRVVPDPELVEIDNFLVEWPTVFAGSFDARFLELPREVVVTALREHQRFFAVEDSKGRLRPAFLAVRNGDVRGLAKVKKGNQDVLVARLEDARFYWETDLAHPPASRVDALAGVVWMEGLGTLRDKAKRLEALAGWLGERLAPGAAQTVRRAALLCKTDLLSEMIGSGKEYASLEGIIGGYYARHAGEPEEVAAAIAEHYRPRGPADALPESDAGSMLALADKLDHVTGAFIAGKVPSGSEDPYGVRRAGNGVVRILIEQHRHLDLRDAAMEMTRPFFAAAPDLPQAQIMKKLGEFWNGRVEAALEERGIPYDVREAALEAQRMHDGTSRTRPGWTDPADCLERAQVLVSFRDDARFEPLVVLFRRVGNILKAATETLPGTLDKDRLAEGAERDLLGSLERAHGSTQPLWERRAYPEILPALLEMEHPIHDFFDHVMVNVDDLPTRVNRLQLLSDVRALFMRGWDLSRIVVQGEG
jgi:glycyl-tRNA synthetase beta chain